MCCKQQRRKKQIRDGRIIKRLDISGIKGKNIDLEHGNYKEFTCGSKSLRFGFKMSLHPLHFFLILMLFFLSFHPLSIDNSKLLQLSLSS